MQHEIFYATGNHAKFKTAQRFLAEKAPFLTLIQVDLDLPELQILDQAEISRYKARAAWQHLQKPVLVDDAGVYFDAYPHFPGFMSKFIWQSLGIEGIFKLLDDNPKAHFSVFFTYCDGTEQLHCFEGTARGTMVRPSFPVDRTSGKPYSYLLAPEGEEESFAQCRLEDMIPNQQFRLNGLQAFADWFTAQQKK